MMNEIGQGASRFPEPAFQSALDRISAAWALSLGILGDERNRIVVGKLLPMGNRLHTEPIDKALQRLGSPVLMKPIRLNGSTGDLVESFQGNVLGNRAGLEPLDDGCDLPLHFAELYL